MENPAGSTRSGVGPDGTPWSTQMTYDYGEVKGTMGADGDPVDVFVNPRGPRKWAFVIHQTDKLVGNWDEDKVFLGFDDAMDAKSAFFKNYDKPENFYGSIEAIPFDDFKKKVLATKNNPTMIHASRMESTIQLFAVGHPNSPFKIGDPVIVDGERGRGVVKEVLPNGRLKIWFRSGLYITRDPMFVHSFNESDYHNKYMTSNVRQGLG